MRNPSKAAELLDAQNLLRRGIGRTLFESSRRGRYRRRTLSTKSFCGRRIRYATKPRSQLRISMDDGDTLLDAMTPGWSVDFGHLAAGRSKAIHWSSRPRLHEGRVSTGSGLKEPTRLARKVDPPHLLPCLGSLGAFCGAD